MADGTDRYTSVPLRGRLWVLGEAGSLRPIFGTNTDLFAWLAGTIPTAVSDGLTARVSDGAIATATQ
jgi:hypothetical protein